MNKRKDQIARVDRRVLPRSEIYVNDLWGNRQVRTIWCKHHRRHEDCRLFFYESSAKSKHPHELRDMCIEAWELTNGKVKFTPDSHTPLATLVSFLKD
jgi:hypothetical protein